MASTTFLWLEITNQCSHRCVHCYSDASPIGTHGEMTDADWTRVIDQAAELDVRMVQYIGGEPTMHPALPVLIDHALNRGLLVEVFSHLAHVTQEMWEVFGRPGVSLATSYYSDDTAQHEAITKRRGSHQDTRMNIARAVELGIPIRAGVIDLGGTQRVGSAHAELAELGVVSIGYDRLRQVGRGIRDQQADVEQLCGHCGGEVAAISASGAVWPCVFARWLPIGNVLDASLATVLDSTRARSVRAELADAFAGRGSCYPDCNPACQPNCSPRCSPTCKPISCRPNSCWPQYRVR